MSSHRIEQATRDLIVELRQKGESFARIGRDSRVNLDRRTAKKVFDEWEREHSQSETRETRLLLKRELMAEHARELVLFARSLARALGMPDPSDERSGEEVFRSFFESHIRVGRGEASVDSDADDTRLVKLRSERLWRDLRAHTATTEWADSVYDYLAARDALLDGRIELEERIEEYLKDEFRREGPAGVALAGRWGLIRRLARGLSFAFINAAMRCADVEPLPPGLQQLDSDGKESMKSYGLCSLRGDRVQVRFAVSKHVVTVEGADEQLHLLVARVMEVASREMADGMTGTELTGKIGKPLLAMMKCHDHLLADAYSPNFKALILDARCDHCPM